MTTKNISKFIFNKAIYEIDDDFGNKIQLIVNYKQAKFRIRTIKNSDTSISKIKNEASKIARDLIARKSFTNFAEKS